MRGSLQLQTLNDHVEYSARQIFILAQFNGLIKSYRELHRYSTIYITRYLICSGTGLGELDF